MNYYVLIAITLTSAFSVAHAGMADISVENVLSAGDFHRTDTSNTIMVISTGDADQGIGSSSRKIDFNHQCAIEVQFRNAGEAATPGEYMLEWFFVGKDVKTKERWVFDAGSRRLDGTEDNIDIASKVLKEHREHNSSTSLAGAVIEGNAPTQTSSRKFKTGDKIEGWIVRLRRGGVIIKTDASLSELRDLAQSSQVSAQLDQILTLPSR